MYTPQHYTWDSKESTRKLSALMIIFSNKQGLKFNIQNQWPPYKPMTNTLRINQKNNPIHNSPPKLMNKSNQEESGSSYRVSSKPAMDTEWESLSEKGKKVQKTKNKKELDRQDNPLMQYSKSVVSNQLLSNWVWCLLHKKFTSGIVNPFKCLG